MEINGTKISLGRMIGVCCRNAWKEVNVFAGSVVHFNDHPQFTLGGGVVCIRQALGIQERKEATVCFCKKNVIEIKEFWDIGSRNEWVKNRKQEFGITE